jgi:hypothetical protein
VSCSDLQRKGLRRSGGSGDAKSGIVRLWDSDLAGCTWAVWLGSGESGICTNEANRNRGWGAATGPGVVWFVEGMKNVYILLFEWRVTGGGEITAGRSGPAGTPGGLLSFGRNRVYSEVWGAAVHCRGPITEAVTST